MNRKDAIELARKLRKRQTQSESIVWSLLRNQKVAGLKFRRQHPIEFSFHGESNFFIADFFNYKLNLIIEIDGAYHIKQKAYDKEREEILIAYGYQIIRFNNEIIENNPSKFLLDLELFINRLNSTL